MTALEQTQTVPAADGEPDHDGLTPRRLDRDPVAVPSESASIDLVSILSGIEETAYVWDLERDQIDWESNAVAILGVAGSETIATGSAFSLLVASEHVTRRANAMDRRSTEDPAHGVPYRVQFRFNPLGRRAQTSLWLEDHGRWWAGADGRPARARGVIRVINERYREEQRLLYRSDHDELTGQLNRIRLTEALAAVLARTEMMRQRSGVLMVAINNLAMINQTFGFNVGDEILASAARVIGERLRGGDTIGRFSSNKFGIIINECTPGALRIAAERFMRAVRESTIRTTACPLSATISIGGVMIPDQASTVGTAINHALQALDLAKTKRHDCFVAYEPSPGQETSRRRNIAIADEIMSALDQNRMRLVLQPIVRAGTREATIYECLLRLERADGILISAGEFIAVAEKLGLSRLIDRRTLELAIQLLIDRSDIELSVNVSGLTCSDQDWLVTLHRLIAGRSDLAARLTVEITETAAIEDLDQSIAFVDTLKELGCKVAIDDFGAGYTSFKNLKHLAVDMVKIDGVFVKDLARDPTDRIFIRTMIDLARSFNMETVAEWVGDEATARLLEAAGITYMQGFHFGKPIAVDELPAPRAGRAAVV